MTTHLENQTEADLLTGSNGRSLESEPVQRARQRAEVAERRGAEPYDALLWRVWSRRPDGSDAAFLVGLCGCSKGAGVSTLAANLAIRAADHGLGPVLLVDANLNSPELHKLMRGEVSHGLADVLAGAATLESCMRATPVTGLDVVPFGAAAGSGVRFEADRIEAMLSQVREQYALAVFDLPVAGELGPTLPLARILEATLLVLRSAQVRKQSAEQITRNLSADGISLTGAVLTDQLGGVPHWLDRLI